MEWKLSQAQLDNGIFELIRKELVLRGYLPDVDIVGLGNGYKVAKQAIVTSGKQVIEIHQPGSYESRGETNTNDIIIGRSIPKPANTGTGRNIEYDFNDLTNKYDKSITADVKYDVPYKITYITKYETYAEIIEDVLRKVIGARMLIKALDNGAVEVGEFWLLEQGQFDTSDIDFIERGWTYLAKNIDLRGVDNLGEIAPFTEFCADVEPKTRAEILTKIRIIYNEDNEPIAIEDIYEIGITFYVNSQGDLICVGPDNDKYQVTSEGDLIFISDDL